MMNTSKLRKAVTVTVAVAAVAALLYYLLFTRTGVKLTHTNVKQLAIYLRSLGPWALVLGMAAVLVQTIVPFVPFVVVAGTNVLVFGLVQGVLINYSMACAGATLAFLFARSTGHSMVERRLSHYPSVMAFNRMMEARGLIYVLIGRLVPVIPSAAINLGAGVSKISFRHFLIGTLIGNLPIVYLESAIAHDMLYIRQHRGRLLLYLVILLGLLAIGHYLKKKYFSKTNAVQTDKQESAGQNNP